MYQSGKVTNPARGQPNKEHGNFFPVPLRTLKFSLARQVRLSRPASAGSFSTPKLNLVLSREFLPFLPLSATTSIYTVCRHRVSPELIGPRNCDRWRSIPRVRRYRGAVVFKVDRVATGAPFSGKPMDQCLCTSSRDEILQYCCCRWVKYVHVYEILP